MEPFGQPYMALEPDLAGTLAGIEGLELSLVEIVRSGAEQVARFHAVDDGQPADVDLVKRDDTGLGGCALFRGARAVEVAMALGTVLAFLPIELLCGLARADVSSELGRQALQLISQAHPHCRSPRALHQIRETIDQLTGVAVPVAGEEIELRIPFLPLELVAETMARLPEEFRRERLPQSDLRPGVEAWALTDPKDAATRVYLIADAQWSIGCTYFRGPASASFARDLAFIIRYLPVEMAKVVCTESTLPLDRARAVYALGLANAPLAAFPYSLDPEAQSCLLVASHDPDETVRGIGLLISLIAADFLRDG